MDENCFVLSALLIFQVVSGRVVFDAAHSEAHLALLGSPGQTSDPNIQLLLDSDSTPLDGLPVQLHHAARRPSVLLQPLCVPDGGDGAQAFAQPTRRCPIEVGAGVCAAVFEVLLCRSFEA